MVYSVDGRVGIDFTGVSSTFSDTLGNTYGASDSSQLIYVKAASAIPFASSYVTINEDFEAIAGTKAAVDDGHQVGIAPASAIASGQYFYAYLRGHPNLRVATLCAADVPLFTTATAGLLDDTSTTAQTKIDGLVLVTAMTTGSGVRECIATWPRSSTF